jgi:hypothetical protein
MTMVLTYVSREAQKLGKLAGQLVRTSSGVMSLSNHIVLSMPEIKLASSSINSLLSTYQPHTCLHVLKSPP